MRVEKCSACSSSAGGTLYWYGAGNDSLVESNLAGTLTSEYVFFNGRRIARRDNTTNPTFYFADHLGSTGGTLGSGGAIKNESDYYPFGGEVMISNTLPQNYKFTGKERDSETGLDDFGARFYSSGFGRFMTPDWAARATAVPYAVFGDPQSLNLYGYVRNDPVSRADADGHQDDANKKTAHPQCGSGPACPGAQNAQQLQLQQDHAQNILRDANGGLTVNGVTNTVTVSNISQSATTNSNGTTTLTTTTTAMAFSSSPGQAGQFLGAAQQTTSVVRDSSGNIVSDKTTTNTLGYGQARSVIGGSGVDFAIGATQPSGLSFFAHAVAADVRSHPVKYFIAGAELGLIFTPLPEAFVAANPGIEEVHAVVDTAGAAGHWLYDSLSEK